MLDFDATPRNEPQIWHDVPSWGRRDLIVARIGGRAYGAVRSSCSETYFSDEDCVLLQTSESRMQPFVGEVRPGRRTQSPTHTSDSEAAMAAHDGMPS